MQYDSEVKHTLSIIIFLKGNSLPKILDIQLNLEQESILRREGFKEYARIKSEIRNQISELLETTNNTGLLQPVMAYEKYTIKKMTKNKVMMDNNASVNGALVPSIFPEAIELAIMVCTIGPRLENKVTEYSKSGETLHAMLLDGIGSTAVDILAQEACHFISREATKHKLQASSPVNPGMPGLAITEQKNILKLAHADEIGVSLTSSGVMVPRKSTSQVIAVGRHMHTWTQEEVCARCNLRETCPHCVLH